MLWGRRFHPSLVTPSATAPDDTITTSQPRLRSSMIWLTQFCKDSTRSPQPLLVSSELPNLMTQRRAFFSLSRSLLIFFQLCFFFCFLFLLFQPGLYFSGQFLATLTTDCGNQIYRYNLINRTADRLPVFLCLILRQKALGVPWQPAGTTAPLPTRWG